MSKPQLFLLHFAGGSIYSFQFIRPYLTDFEFIPVELPGRGKRAKEILIKDFDLATEDIYKEIMTKLESRPFLIYGHSMGARLALEVAALLEKSNKYADGIIVSGNAGPNVKDEKKRYLMEMEAFKAELKEIGGMPEEVLQSEELLSYFVPLLKADFEIVEKDYRRLALPVKAPIYAIMGTQEECVKQINNWENFTTSRFEYDLLEGNHFFIYNHAEKIATIIKNWYIRHVQC